MNVVKDKIEPKPFLPKKGNNRGLLGLIGLISLMGLISLGLMGCGGGGGDDRTGQTPTTPPTPPTTDPTEPTDPPTPPTPTEVAISFSGNEEEARTVEQGGNRASRRAGTPLSQSATSFTVWGYKNMSESAGDYGGLQTVFPGYTVKWINGSASSTSSNTSGWEYVAQQTGGDPEQTIKYWDMNASAYRFFAVTGSPTHESHDTNHEFTMTADCSGATDEAIAANMAETPFFSHLWFSTSTNVDKQFGKPVTLEFLKPFARVRFMFNYSYAPEGVKVENPSFKPTDVEKKIALKGAFTVSYPLTGTATKETYTLTPKESPTEEEVLTAFTQEYIPEGTEKWYMVFPVDTQDSYTMSVSVNGNEKTAVVPKEYMSWKPGYSYTYIFKITVEGGVVIDLVQSAVTPWTEMEIDYTTYNW